MKEESVVMAFGVAERANMTPEELYDIERRKHDEATQEYAMELVRQRGLERGLKIGVTEILQSRFGDIPADVQQLLDDVSDTDKLRQATVQAVTAGTVADFIAWLNR